MLTKGGLIGQKQEMTRIRKDDKMIPATLVKLCAQEVVQVKTKEKDGYTALVVGVGKQVSTKEKGPKAKYVRMTEYLVDAATAEQYPVGTVLDASMLSEDVSSLRIMGRSKGKGFAGVMKRHNFGGGPATHGSKFHRAGGSTGNRKPRRTIRGWKMAGHMGDDNITLRSVPLLDVWKDGDDTYLVMKGSLPGGYNGYIKCCVM